MSGHTPGYEVMADGRVLSLAHNWRGLGQRELSQSLNSHGYPSVRLTIDGKRTRHAVHRLVADAHLEPRPSLAHEVRHLDGDKLNPSANNLAWGTPKENAEDRERHGRTSSGLSHAAAIRAGRSDAFNDAEILSVLRLSFRGMSQRDIADRLGRSQSAVGAIIRSRA